MREDIYDQINKQESFYWWHVSRKKLFLQMLRKYWTGSVRDQPHKLLDVGCGTGQLMRELKPFGKVWGLDIKAKALHYCRKKKAGNRLLKANLERKLPLSNNVFDVILCLDVLEHLQDDGFVLSELYRVLKKKGIILFSVPAYNSLWSCWDKVAGHHRRYTAKSLEKILKVNGFKPLKLSYYNLFALLPAVIFRLIKSFRRFEVKDYPSDFIDLPNVVNNFLLFLAYLERKLLSFVDLPVGLSLFCLAKKEGEI